mgnify:FL=1
MLCGKEGEKIKRACSKCGRIHKDGEVCPLTPHRTRVYAKSSERGSTRDPLFISFRSSKAWQDRRKIIRARDGHLCRACLANLPGTVCRINTKRLSVHHIVSLKEDWERRFDGENLITLCDVHHELAEKGAIPARVLAEMARNLERARTPPEGLL